MTERSNNQYLAVPRSGRGAGVLVLHAWWGLTGYIREFCDRLAEQGFVALAPDLFDGQVMRTVAQAEQHLQVYDEANDAPPKVLAAAEELSRQPSVAGKGLGVIGFSMGAYWALWLAQQKPDQFRAVTLFYGSNGGGGDFSTSQAAFLGHFAETDPYEPASGIQQLEANLRGANRPAAFHTYPGTGHWFMETDRPDVYHAPSAQLAWERTIAFLHDQLDSASG